MTPPNPYNPDQTERELFATSRTRLYSRADTSPRRKDAMGAVLMAPVTKEIAKQFYDQAKAEGVTPCDLLASMLNERIK
ncbi:MAG: hypothetical protein GKR97_10000 [Rhizobiaceae bacterium]|nr:hypothetical protein [Rhizobiaceae bacterium]